MIVIPLATGGRVMNERKMESSPVSFQYLSLPISINPTLHLNFLESSCDLYPQKNWG